MRLTTAIWGVALILPLACLCPAVCADKTTADSEPLVRVNQHVITQADFEIACLVRGIEESQQTAVQRRLLERLVDERLIADFLKSRRIKASPKALDAQVNLIESLIRRRGEEPDKLLEQLGFTNEQLRETLKLPLAWKAFVATVVPDDRLREEFDAHRRQLDGTKLRARHIVLKVASDATDEAWDNAEQESMSIRKRISASEVSFVEAAQQFSQGPSANAGGDVGFFPYRGIMSAAFADAAFALKPNELSQPIRTSVGVHLIEVTEEQPGQLSLEDVRPAVLERISQSMWAEQVAMLRAGASISFSDSSE